MSIQTSIDALPARRPTPIRHLVVLAATAMAVLLYLDRFCLSFCERYIVEDLGLSNAQAGWLLSAFFWTYALAQVPAGWLSDRFGPRAMLAVYIVAWSLFTGLIGLAGGFTLILLFRLGTGLGQAGAYPTSANLLSKWAPFRSRALASGLVSTGGRIGGFIAPVLTAYLMVLFVPLSVPSALAPEDLLDPQKLCQQLSRTDDSPQARLAAVIRAELPAGLEAVIRRHARETDPPLTGEERAALTAGLNAVLERPNLYLEVTPAEFPLPEEAKALAERSSGELTPEQVRRRNRLLLEAAYPDAVRKVYVAGWRPALIVYGVAGLAVALFFWLVVRDRPEEHPLCNEAEVALIGQGRPRSLPPVGGIPWRHIVRSRSLWLSSLSQVGTNFGWVFLVTLLPRYLAEAHRVPILERGWLASLPILAGAFGGMVVGGVVTDLLTRRLGVRWGRGLPMSLSRFCAMGAYLACLWLDSAWAVTLAFCVVAVSTDLGTASVWAFKQDVGGRHVGSVLGWGNMWGNLGAAVAPVALTAIVGADRWELCFLACAGAFLVAGVAALGVDARIPVVPEGLPEGVGDRVGAIQFAGPEDERMQDRIDDRGDRRITE